MKNILLQPNIFKDVNFAASTKVLNELALYDCNVYVDKEFEGYIPANDFEKKKKIVFASQTEAMKEADACIVLGGDGSILAAARDAALYDLPILGINLGRIGYMAEVETDELALLRKLFEDNYTCDERMMLSCQIERNGKIIKTSNALNDVVVSKGSVSKAVDIELYSDKKKVIFYRADGLILSTPTGSTAYSMSAGGPIIDPHMNCICVIPVCSYSLASRPLLFSNKSELSVKNACTREKSLFVTIDGGENYELELDDSVNVSKSEYKTKLIKLKDVGFYDILREKMKNTED